MFSVPDSSRWSGQDVFVIGGGSSLRGFDFERLRGRNTVGCNVAYEHGPEICQVVLFSDFPFFEEHRGGLEEYHRMGGEVWSTCRDLFPRTDIDFIHKIQRKNRGLWPGVVGLGYGGSTGPSAVNLALAMGATRVLLLGMDGGMPPGCQNKNWHDRYKVKIPSEPVALFAKFQDGFRAVANDLPVRYPGRAIINLGPNSSLPFFPKESVNKWLSELQTLPSAR